MFNCSIRPIPRVVYILCVCWLSLVYPAAALADEEIVLGAATSLTFLEGRESLNAAILAAEEINGQGGLSLKGKKHLLRIESIDIMGARPGEPASRAVGRLEKFIMEKKVRAIVVGPYRSEVLLPSMDVIARHRIPLLGAIAMTSATEAKILKNEHYRYIFRVGLNSKYLVEYLIDTMKFLREQYGYNRVAMMIQDVAWTRTTASQISRLYFDRQGWLNIGTDTFPSGVVDFGPALSHADKNGVQVILSLFDMPESSDLVKLWHAQKSHALLFGFISPIAGASAFQTFGETIAGSLNVIFELGNVPSVRWGPAQAFYNAYHKRYGVVIESGHGPAPAYESVYILASAIERAGTLDADMIVKALESTDRIGAMGRMRFHKGHQIVFGRDPKEYALACIFQWQHDGSRKIVYPLSIADGSIMWPDSLGK